MSTPENVSADTAAPSVAQEAPQGAPPAEEHRPLTLTPKAVTMVKLTRQEEGLDETHALRVAVMGGGCSGFQYALDFTSEQRDNDYVFDYEGLKVFVDAVSARYLDGTQIDYVMGTSGAGFKFNNPKAVGSCGCGSSFAV